MLYDRLGRTIAVKNAVGDVSAAWYDGNGNVVAQANGKANLAFDSSDAIGRMKVSGKSYSGNGFPSGKFEKYVDEFYV